MKKIIGAALAASAFVAAPAMANDFTGLRVEGTVGVDDATQIPERSDLNYGAAIGLDTTFLGDDLIVGVEANVDNVFDYKDYGVSARLGVKIADPVLVYGEAGYADFRGMEGVRVGGGVEVAVTEHTYAKVEYRYSDLEADTGRHQALVGVGIRF